MSAFGLAVTCHVFKRGKNFVIGNREAFALEARNRRYAHARDEVRVFAICFLNTAPTRVNGNVNNRGEDVVCAAHANFAGRDGINIFHEFSVKGCGECNGLREGGCVAALEAMQAFFVEHCRNAEACLFDMPFLNSVIELNGLARRAGGHAARHRRVIGVAIIALIFHAKGVLGTGPTANAVREVLFHLFRIKRAVFFENFGFVEPDTANLSEFLI